MRYFKYCEPGCDKIISEARIIKEWFPYWEKQMKRANKKDLISYENCIEDFCNVHWAYEVKLDG